MSATGFRAADFGRLESAETNAAATGTTVNTGFVLAKEMTVFSTVGPGAIALLPAGPNASNCRVTLRNRGANSLILVTTTDQIENYGTSVSVAPGGDATLECGDATLVQPKTWWLS